MAEVAKTEEHRAEEVHRAEMDRMWKLSQSEQDFEAHVEAQGIPTGLTAQTRIKRLTEDFGFRMAEKAEYAFLESCYMPYVIPEGLRAFRKLLDHFGVDYSLLPRYNCCGAPLFLNALKAKDQERLKRADAVALRSIQNNIKQVKAMGAKALVYMCAGCESIYGRFSHMLDFELIWYPELLERIFTGGKLELKADYYAGCYVFNNKIGSFPPLDTVNNILRRIEGLEINYIENRFCCVRPNELETIANHCKNEVVINICDHCHHAVGDAIKKRGKKGSILLPELLLQAVNGETPEVLRG